MAVVVGSLLVAWSIMAALGRLRPAFGLRRTWPLVLLFLIPIVWAALQSLSITPQAWHHPLWQSAAEVLGMELAGSISLDSISLSILESMACSSRRGAPFHRWDREARQRRSPAHHAAPADDENVQGVHSRGEYTRWRDGRTLARAAL